MFCTVLLCALIVPGIVIVLSPISWAEIQASILERIKCFFTCLNNYQISSNRLSYLSSAFSKVSFSDTMGRSLSIKTFICSMDYVQVAFVLFNFKNDWARPDSQAF